jgi:hypothetical protein
MRKELDFDAIIDILPIGMMVEGFGFKGHLGHEAEGTFKVFKFKILTKTAISELPRLEALEFFQDLGLRQF